MLSSKVRCTACVKVLRVRVEHAAIRVASIYTADIEHAAGKLRAPETLYDSVTKNVVSKVDTVLPVSKAEFQAYKSETTAVINSLVGELNSLTPVSSLILVCTT